MRLVMTGLDYTTADMNIREVFAPDAAKQRELLRGIVGDDIAGCVLIATCNRTELYLSFRGDVPPDGVDALCRGLDTDARSHRRYFVERSERQAVMHLMRVAAGARSMVPGDAQIITQVRTALETAREADTADPLLEALFRSAITAGKKVRTHAALARDGSSIAQRAAREAERRLGGLSGRSALVVGNGAIGLLAAARLLEMGCDVAVTLRDQRRRNELPAGCRAVPFAERYRALAGRDLVLSATSSPRRTIEAAELEGLDALPRLFVDLAVPRDVDPAVGGLPGVTLLNVDELGEGGAEDDTLRRQLAKIDDIVQLEADRFNLWRRNRRRHLPADSGTPDFPLFVNLRGAAVLVAGGGKVAARRAEKLLSFGARVHVVAPELAPEMARLAGRDGFRWTCGHYHPGHMDGVTLAIAATDRREVNAGVGRDARSRGILVSVADRRRECTFYFPAIVRSDVLTAGIVSNNGDHRLVKRAAAGIREKMEEIDADYQGGEPGE